METIPEKPAPRKIFAAEETEETEPETRDEKTSFATSRTFPHKKGYSWYIAVDEKRKIKFICVKDGVATKIEAKRYRAFIPLSKKRSDD